MQSHIKKFIIKKIQLENIVENKQMAGRRNGQKLGDALNQTGENSEQIRHKI